MLYGLHAVGLTAGMQQRLSAADARFVRAIARDPVHLTKTSNYALYQKLRLKDLPTVLAKLLASRARKSADPEAAEVFKQHHSLALAWQGQTRLYHQRGLYPTEADKMLPCDVCGMYFSCMQHLLSHKARMHNTQKPRKTGVMPSRQYTASAVDGMPVCAHCGSTFTRVEALKKHLSCACPVLFQQQHQIRPSSALEGSTSQQSATAHPAGHACTSPEATVKVAEVSLGLLGSSDRAPLPVQGVRAPLIDDPAFRQAIMQGWKQAIRSREFANSLCQYCVLCGQWVDTTGVKQHHRLMHGEQWALKAEACSRIGSLGLVVSSPCHYCAKPFKDPRAHLKACAVTYQASLAELVIRQEPHVLHRGGSSTHIGSPRDDGCVGPCEEAGWQQCGGRGPPRTHGEHGAGRLEEGQVCSVGAKGHGRKRLVAVGELAAHQGQLVRRREGCTGGDWCGPGYSAVAVGAGQTGHSARGGAGEDSHRYDADLLPGYGGNGHCATSQTGGRSLVGTVRGGHGSLAAEGDPPPEHLRGGRSADHNNPPGGREAGQGQGMAMASGGTHGVGPLLDVLPVESSNPAARAQRPASDQELGDSSQAGLSGQKLGGGRRADKVQGHATDVPDGSLRQCSLAVFLFPESQGRNGGKEPRGNQGHGELLGSEAHRHEDQASSRGATTPGRRIGKGLPGSSVYRLAGATALEQAEAQAGSGGAEGDRALNAHAPVALKVHNQHAPPQAQLQNPHQICYLNSVAQALCWLALLADDVLSCGGKARTAIMLAQRAHKPYLPDCLAWHPILRGWSQLKQQHDAGMFLTHVLTYAAPAALCGVWQARLCNPDTVTDAGPLTSPILLEVQGRDLQSAVHYWHRQHTIHALTSHGGAVVLQLNRYSFLEGAPRKVCQPVNILPGSTVQMPIFAARGIEVSFQPFRVAFVIFHLGDRVTSGHYQTALCVRRRPESAQQPAHGLDVWEFQICNDRCRPRVATTRDLDCIHCNAYLVGLLYSPNDE